MFSIPEKGQEFKQLKTEKQNVTYTLVFLYYVLFYDDVQIF